MSARSALHGTLTLIFGFAILAPAWADTELAREFERAANSAADPDNSHSFAIEGCTFRHKHVNFVFCPKQSETHESNRIIRTIVDLNEIGTISAKDVQGHFMLRFEADMPQPGPLWILADRLKNSDEGQFDRYVAATAAMRKDIALNSKETFTNCDGIEKPISGITAFTILLPHAPEGWHRLADMARECRAGKGLTFQDGHTP